MRVRVLVISLLAMFASVTVYADPITKWAEFSQDTIEFDILEDAKSGDYIGSPLKDLASTKDGGNHTNHLTFSRVVVSGAGAHDISVNHKTGQLYMADATLDYETNTTIVVKVTCTHSYNPSPNHNDDITVTIHVGDVLDDPEEPIDYMDRSNGNEVRKLEKSLHDGRDKMCLIESASGSNYIMLFGVLSLLSVVALRKKAIA